MSIGASSVGIIGSIFLYIVFLGLLIAYLVFMIIVLIKANKALSIWIKKNDTDIHPKSPPTPQSPPEKTNLNKSEE